MKLSTPKNVTFYIAAVLWLLGLLGIWVTQISAAATPMGQGLHVWLLALGGLVLILGNVLDGV